MRFFLDRPTFNESSIGWQEWPILIQHLEGETTYWVEGWMTWRVKFLWCFFASWRCFLQGRNVLTTKKNMIETKNNLKCWDFLLRCLGFTMFYLFVSFCIIWSYRFPISIVKGSKPLKPWPPGVSRANVPIAGLLCRCSPSEISVTSGPFRTRRCLLPFFCDGTFFGTKIWWNMTFGTKAAKNFRIFCVRTSLSCQMHDVGVEKHFFLPYILQYESREQLVCWFVGPYPSCYNPQAFSKAQTFEGRIPQQSWLNEFQKRRSRCHTDNQLL